MSHKAQEKYGDSAIAVIGMSCRFPGAETVPEFWEQMMSGKVASHETAKEEFDALFGKSYDEIWGNPNLVKVCYPIAESDCFDYEFFGYTPYEASILDPQQRVLLEVGYQALEASGHIKDRSDFPISVYGSVADSRYLPSFLYPKLGGGPGTVELIHAFTANSVGTAAPRLSYHLGLTGASLSVHTGCSSSLVAIHLACQDMLEYNSDIAIVAACSINPTVHAGYLHIPNGPLSPDGKCRPYDAQAAGTVPGDGAAAVVLKRLEDALHDSDHIHAVIRGTAINNDAKRKVGFTAPSVEGQQEVIRNALLVADVAAESIGYVEGHGSATALGDSIEVAALTQAFRESTNLENFCGLGSVKGNFGHLGVAAGIAGFMRAVLAVERGMIPGIANFQAENPGLMLGSSPFWVQKDSAQWNHPTSGQRRAGVSSFGVGGTNAHLVLENYEPADDPGPSGVAWTGPEAGTRPRWEVIPVTAHTPRALRKNLDALAEYLQQHTEAPLEQTAAYFRSNREQFPYRSAIVATSGEDAVTAIKSQGGRRDFARLQEGAKVCFAFPGGGSQYPGMGRDLYQEVEPFRASVDHCLAILGEPGSKIRESFQREMTLLPADEMVSLAIVEYSLARSVMDNNVTPVVMVGHSLGEYVAACLSGVLSLEDMLLLVSERFRLIGQISGVSMSVPLSEEEVRPFLTAGVSLAAVNTPSACLVSGDEESMAGLEKRLLAKGIESRRIAVKGAAHSHLLDGILDEFRSVAQSVVLREPEIPYMSMLEGRWAGKEQRITSEYWVRHIRSTVRFAKGAQRLFAQEPSEDDRAGGGHVPDVVVEIGPGDTLIKFMKQSVGEQTRFTSVQTMRKARGSTPDMQMYLECLGGLWALGAGDLPSAADLPQNGLAVDFPRYSFDRAKVSIGGKAWSGSGAQPSRLEPEKASREVDDDEETCGNAEFEQFLSEYGEDDNKISEYRVICELWEKRVGRDRVSVDGNFFDLGGDSLQASLLAAEICQRTKLSISTQGIIKNPTLRALICFLAESSGGGQEGSPSDDEKFPMLLRAKSEGNRPPLFCVHPGSGISWMYLRLLKFLNHDQPLYALQAAGLIEGSKVAGSFDEMVEQYIALMRSVQPNGPYRILGWSYGGVVAHTIAAKLLRTGEKVDFVILADSPAPSNFPTAVEDIERIVDSFMERLLLAPSAPVEGDDTGQGFVGLLDHGDITRLRRVVGNNLSIICGHELPVIDCNVYFIDAMKAGRADSGVADPASLPNKSEAWQKYCSSQMRVYKIEADHYELLDGENLNVLGQILREILQNQDSSITGSKSSGKNVSPAVGIPQNIVAKPSRALE